MMKKMLAVLCAAVMTIGAVTTVFAAPSPTVSGVVSNVSKAVDADGNAVEVSLKEIPEEYKAAVEEIKNIDKVKELLGDAYVEGMQVLDVKEVTVPEGTKFPATLTFNVPGVKPGTKVAVLHYDTEAKAWEVITAKAGDGTIEATFDSLSPVAFVVEGAAASGSVTTTSGGSTTTTSTSPKTGETPVGAYAGVIAMIAALGMGVTFYKKRKAA